MNKQNSFNYIWPTLFGSFYNSEHQKIKYELINFFEKYKIENPSGRKAGENLKLYESKYDLHRQNNEIIQNVFKNFIVKSFFETAKEANKNYLGQFSNSQLAVNITDAWFIHYEKGGFVAPHAHGDCSWCCVYYVQLGENASRKNGGTYFQKPYPARSTFDFGAFYNKETSVDMYPEEGKMLVWPSYLMHGSYPYDGKNDRIIISANARISVMQDGKAVRSI